MHTQGIKKKVCNIASKISQIKWSHLTKGVYLKALPDANSPSNKIAIHFQSFQFDLIFV